MASFPLFPLAVVLFPGSLMPLHIFEPRYRALLADCTTDGRRFVILPPAQGGGDPLPGTIGTVARILAVQPLGDGRSNVVVSGETRITLETLESDQRPYRTGQCEVLPDEPESQVATAAEVIMIRDLAVRFAAALGVIGEVDQKAELAAEPGLLTFQVASLMDWDLEVKRQFLSIRSVFARVTRLLHTLPSQVTDIEWRAAIHQRASTNGHGPHRP